jgi:hypothetical protein
MRQPTVSINITPLRQLDGVDLALEAEIERAAFVHSLRAGQTVNEYKPAGAAAAEIRESIQVTLQTRQKDYNQSDPQGG